MISMRFPEAKYYKDTSILVDIDPTAHWDNYRADETLTRAKERGNACCDELVSGWLQEKCSGLIFAFLVVA